MNKTLRDMLSISFLGSLLGTFLAASPSLAQDRFSADVLAGGWKANKPPMVYDIAVGEGGQIRGEYGYEGQLRTVGRCGGQFDGKFMHGSWASQNDRGALLLELVTPELGLITWWEGTDTELPFAGRYHIHKMTNAVGTRRQRAETIDAARWAMIEQAAAEAQQQKLSQEQWITNARNVRQQLEQRGWWHEAWWLPSAMREAPMTAWSAGHVENAFVDIAHAAAERDQSPPARLTSRPAFPDPQAQPLPHNPRIRTSYSKANQQALSGQPFAQAALDRTTSHVQIYYGAWDYLTSNQSHGVIARPIHDLPNPPTIVLHNTKERAITGRYDVQVEDGMRVIAKATGKITIAPDSEQEVRLESVSSPYWFFWPHVKLSFIPDAYEPRPIPKDQVHPFHKTLTQYAAVRDDESAELDFVDAILWARVEQAWEANDLKRYARAVRDAGGRLFYAAEQSPEVRIYVREHLEPLERLLGYFDPSQSEGLHTGIASLTVPVKRAASPHDRERASKPAAPQPEAVEVDVALKHGVFVIGKPGTRVTLHGKVEIFDGPVCVGRYPLDDTLDFTESEVRIAAADRTVTFYQNNPAFRARLTISRWERQPRNSHRRPSSLAERLNRIVPGWRSALHPLSR